jgi:hypothetical protein
LAQEGHQPPTVYTPNLVFAGWSASEAGSFTYSPNVRATYVQGFSREEVFPVRDSWLRSLNTGEGVVVYLLLPPQPTVDSAPSWAYTAQKCY